MNRAPPTRAKETGRAQASESRRNTAEFSIQDNRAASVAQLQQIARIQHASNNRAAIQRNQDVVGYAPSAENSMTEAFIACHAPLGDGYTVENAIEIHEVRGALETNTIVAIDGEEMAEEIYNFLDGLSDEMSRRLEDEAWESSTFTTQNSYPSIETVLDEDGGAQFSVAEITQIRIRIRYHNGYYQAYHFGGKA